MKKLISILAICCLATTVKAQSITIDKQLKDFPDTFDLTTPLNAGITCSYLIVNGKENLWREASAFMLREYLPKSNAPDKTVNEASKTMMLNGTIKEVIVYKDSIAGMITEIDSAYYSIRVLGFEDGKWLNIGEDLGRGLENSREVFYAKAPNILNRLCRSIEVKSVSTDTLMFVNYVNQHGVEPKDFLLEALANYPLVIYGELHRRKISWDCLTSVLYDPRFPEKVGIVFVELPSYQQTEFDKFYASKELDTEILLEIMRSEQIYGWWDRGEYEFLINIWKLNQTLTVDKQIKVVATDKQAPWKFLHTSEDFEKHEENDIDRNTNMANVIEQTIKTKTDTRNSLFIVGYGHAYKSHVPGGSSAARGQDPALTAGAQLVQRLSSENVFVVLQHVPMGTNSGALGFMRQGFFDTVFEKIGNKPIAFHLVDSPFGAEPFDADYQMSFDSRVGTFADNFDGYIFLQPLRDEESDYILYDIWSDQFIEEMKRRAILYDFDFNRWLGTEGELTKEKIITVFKEKYEGKKRWIQLFE
ncbi:MAG: hypothetical protein FWH23_03930 [Bacteroidales bacterium]|nr:hypothetical protein [Bacteroidales bacterium]